MWSTDHGYVFMYVYNIFSHPCTSPFQHWKMACLGNDSSLVFYSPPSDLRLSFYFVQSLSFFLSIHCVSPSTLDWNATSSVSEWRTLICGAHLDLCQLDSNKGRGIRRVSHKTIPVASNASSLTGAKLNFYHDLIQQFRWGHFLIAFYCTQQK